MIALAGVCSAEPTFEHAIRLNRVYDVVRRFKPQAFKDSRLQATLDKFIATECGQDKVARLILAADSESLFGATNVFLPEYPREGIEKLLSVAPEMLGGDLTKSTFAEVLCIQGNVTESIRINSRVTHRQIAGTDAHRYTFEGVDIKLVGLTIPGEQRYVNLFVTAGEVPSDTAARKITRVFEQMMGHPTVVHFRRTPHFFDLNGPASDPFDQTARRISAEQFLNQRSISCQSSPSGTSCTGFGRIDRNGTDSLQEPRRPNAKIHPE